MAPIVAAFWGAYAAAALLVLGFALWVYYHHRIRPAQFGLAVVLTLSLYALLALGWLGTTPGAGVHMRAVGFASLGICCFFLWLLLKTTDRVRHRVNERRLCVTLVLLALGTGVLTLWISPASGLLLCALVCLASCTWALSLCVADLRQRQALAGPLLMGALATVPAVASATLLAAGYDHWLWHLLLMGSSVTILGAASQILWLRFSFLLDLSAALRSGPNFDPVSRSSAIADVIDRQLHSGRQRQQRSYLVGTMVIKLINLPELEQSHGAIAKNLALYIMVARMRRVTGNSALFGHIDSGTYVMVLQNISNARQMVHLGQAVRRQLGRSLKLQTQDFVHSHQELPTRPVVWQPNFGIGLYSGPLWELQKPQTMALAESMAREAATHGSRMAWYDDTTHQIMPVQHVPGL